MYDLHYNLQVVFCVVLSERGRYQAGLDTWVAMQDGGFGRRGRRWGSDVSIS